ncbi:MAG TPA: hypothetical protein VMC41_00525 [Candidatus Nanoarchaeia archaeon]|nr:hypothetical protein [Candidatus Nanoarchaeia archaeon]
MADGMRCKYCGFQETDHDLGGQLGSKETANYLLSGRKFTLNQCLKEHGFTPENANLAKKLEKKAEDEAAEQSIRRRKLAVFGERDYDD